MAKRNLLFKFLKFYNKNYFLIPSALRCNTCTKSHFENMLSTYMCPPDAALPQVFDEMKNQKSIRKDMKQSLNSVSDLLVYSKCPIK